MERLKRKRADGTGGTEHPTPYCVLAMVYACIRHVRARAVFFLCDVCNVRLREQW